MGGRRILSFGMGPWSGCEGGLAMTDGITTRYGRIIIDEEVAATIAGIAATECYGVVGMASRRIKDGIAELLGRENLARGVKVTFDDGQAIITVNIVVGYGIRISEVAHNVMHKVKYMVENLTGLRVARVKINVQGVKVNGGA